MTLESLILGSLIAYLVLDQYLFRFQRTTLQISRKLNDGFRSIDLQNAMTPTWMGVLGWGRMLAGIALSVLIWLVWGWLALAGFLAYKFLLGAWVDFISPMPTYGHCIKRIETTLARDGNTVLLERVRQFRGCSEPAIWTTRRE